MTTFSEKEKTQQRNRKENKTMSKIDIIRLERLERRVEDIERNVGSVMNELNLIAIASCESSKNYSDGYNNPIKSIGYASAKTINSAMINDDKKISFVINKTVIYEYDGTAIYDLHTPSKLAYIWKNHMFDGGGVIRSMTVSDIKKFFYENPEFAEPGFFNIVQDINHMSDIYIIDKTK